MSVVRPRSYSDPSGYRSEDIREVAAQATIAHSGPDQLRVDVRPMDEMRIDVRPASSNNAVKLFNQYSSAFSHHYRMSRTDQDRMNTLHGRFETALGPDLNRDTLRVSYTRRLLSYEDNTGAKKFKTFEELIQEDPEMANVVREAEEFAEEITGTRLDKHQFDVRGKGDAKGFKPLNRSNESLQNLPKHQRNAAMGLVDFTAPMTFFAQRHFNAREEDPAKQGAALARLTQGQRLLQQFFSEIDHRIRDREERIDTLNAHITANPAPPNLNQLQQEKARLERQKNLLERRRYHLEHNFDTAAFFLAVAFAPDNRDARSILIAQRKLEMALQTEITQRTQDLENQKPFWNKLPILNRWGTQYNFKKNPEYIEDTKNLLFSLLPPAEARHYFLDSCRSHDLPVRKDSWEDFAIRSLLRPDTDAALFETEVFQGTDQ